MNEADKWTSDINKRERAALKKRFIVHASYADARRPDHVCSWATAEEAIESATHLYQTKVPLRVWVREHGLDPATLPKTIWRDGKVMP